MNEELNERTPIDGMPQTLGPLSNMIGNEKEYYRSTAELLREHHVEIRFLSIGCVIRVGCKEIAFEDRDKAMVELMDYVRDPRTAIKKWKQRFDQ